MTQVTYGGHEFTQGIKTPLIPCNGGYVSNLGLDLASGKLKIVQADGSDCTSQAQGYVCMPSTTAGQYVTLEVTDANHFFEDDSAATSDFWSGSTGMPFGTSSGTWNQDRPLMLYAVNTDNTSSGLYFAFSFQPNKTRTGSSSTGRGYQDTPPSSDADGNLIFMTSTDVTGAGFNSKPCMPIGALKIRKTNGDGEGDWTFQALSSQDGIGVYSNFSGIAFTMPTGQMGSASGKYLLDNGGTAPTFSTNTFTYNIDINGICSNKIFLSGDGGTAGSGAVTAFVALPYLNTNDYNNSSVYVIDQNAASERIGIGRLEGNESRFYIIAPIASSGNLQNQTEIIQLNDFSVGSRLISCFMQFKAF